MLAFILRRIFVSLLVLLGASFLVYLLVAASGDPLEDLRNSNAPNREQLIQARTEALQLNTPPVARYFLWLGGVAKCVVPFAAQCDLGKNLQGQEVTQLLPQAMSSTLKLVTAAVILAIILGITVGITTALRQYTFYDYSFTFVAFLFFSLPSFWVAVLAKEFIAVGFNDFLLEPTIGPVALILIAVGFGLVAQLIVGGPARRRVMTFIGAAAAAGLLLWYFSATKWFADPSLGPVGVVISVAAVAYVTTAIVAGLNNKRALLTAGIQAAIAVIVYFSIQGLFDISTFIVIVQLAVITVIVGLATGWFLGGHDKGQAMRVGAITAVLCGFVLLVDRFLQSWREYANLPSVFGHPIATVGSSTPNLDSNFWVNGLDTFTHLLLPTITLLLVSFAGYSRFARAGTLEVMNQDYIRTARAKGLNERTIVVRHAFRNSLIPITTLVAADVGALLGGAIITEQIFAIPGMGNLFQTALLRVDPNPVMAYFVVIAAMAILFNFLADLSYAALDPRVRVAA